MQKYFLGHFGVWIGKDFQFRTDLEIFQQTHEVTSLLESAQSVYFCPILYSIHVPSVRVVKWLYEGEYYGWLACSVKWRVRV